MPKRAEPLLEFLEGPSRSPLGGEMGHILLTVVGMVAQMERGFINERLPDDIETAKASGH